MWVTCYTQPCKPCKLAYILHYLPQGDESSPRGRWGICAPALPEVLTESPRTPLYPLPIYKLSSKPTRLANLPFVAHAGLQYSMTWTLMHISTQLFPIHVNPSHMHWHCLRITPPNLSITLLLRELVIPQIYLLLGSWVFGFSTNSSHWTAVRYLAPYWVFPTGSQLMGMAHFWVPSRQEHRCIPTYCW
jgi:hypothetical protein